MERSPARGRKFSATDVWMALAGIASALLLIFAAAESQAQTFTALHAFTGGADGGAPQAGLSMDRAGNLYGTTNDGGNGYGCVGNCGVVYRLQRKNSSWLYSKLYDFTGEPDGANPAARVIVGSDGSLYGTTLRGGEARLGTVFRLQPPPTFCRAISCPWTETVLHSFLGGGDGANPAYGDLTFDPAGNIYGTTPYGGSYGCGVVYELSHSGGGWTETILYTFTCGMDGDQPFAGVILDSSGNLYGTTVTGGGVGLGTVYQLTHSGSGWVETTIHDFQYPGGAYGGLTFDSGGNLFGIAYEGPTVYELSPSNGGWIYTELYSIGGSGAVAQPTLDSAGNIYGTQLSGGLEVFRLTPSGGQYTLTGFNGSVGRLPYSNVILDASGNLYATASNGGTSGAGVVFEITP